MIKISNLTHFYGNFCAVKNVSFNVKKGEIVCLLGPNGAGKSTILKIISSQLIPTKGDVLLNGINVIENPVEAKKNLGFLPEIPPLYEVFEVNEYLKFVAEAKRLSGKVLKERMEWVKEFIGLKNVWKKPIGELSRGYRQRVGIAQAIINDPPIIILDEPTTGLDPLQTIEIRELIKILSKDKAILFSTHIMQEPTALAQKVIILNEGNLIAKGTIEGLAKNCRIEEKDMEKIFISYVKKDMMMRNNYNV